MRISKGDGYTPYVCAATCAQASLIGDQATGNDCAHWWHSKHAGTSMQCDSCDGAGRQQLHAQARNTTTKQMSITRWRIRGIAKGPASKQTKETEQR